MEFGAIMHDIKVGSSIAVATFSSGTATFLHWIPPEVGKLATLIGIFLSVVLIYVHLKRSDRESEKHKLEIKLLKKQLAESEAAKKEEKSNGPEIL